MTAAVDAAEFRRTVGLFASGVTVVTTQVDGILHGMTANAFCSVSLDPLLVLVCVNREAGLHGLLERSGQFAITVLAAGQEGVSRWFASSRRPAGQDQFDDQRWRPAPHTGAPVLTDGLAYLDCRLHQAHQAGDHTVCIGQVLALGPLDGTEPLVWYQGRYAGLADQTG